MAWFERLPRPLLGWLTVGGMLCGLIGGAFAMGAATSSTASDYRSLPARMGSVEAKLPPLEADVLLLKAQAEVNVHKWATLDTIQADVGEIRCILRAQVEGVSASRCLGTYR
jgi:hypothetical protein